MASAQDLKAVLFDFDGTLYDLEVDYGSFLQRWSGAGDSVTRILAALEGKELDEALKETEAVEMAGVRRGRALPGAAEALRAVMLQYPVAVISRNARATIEAGLAVMGVAEVLIVGREAVRLQKPAAEGIELALGQLNAKGAILVGDSLHDVEAAAAAGVPSIIVRNEKLAFQPDKADYYVENIREVPALIEDMV